MTITYGSPSHYTVCTWERDHEYSEKCCNACLAYIARTHKFLFDYLKKNTESNLLQEFNCHFFL